MPAKPALTYTISAATMQSLIPQEFIEQKMKTMSLCVSLWFLLAAVALQAEETNQAGGRLVLEASGQTKDCGVTTLRRMQS